MPYLYCEQHGKEHEDRVIDQAAVYRQEGESVLIVKGTLRSGPWKCDHCNAALRKGDTAYLLSTFPHWLQELMSAYDLTYERRYFAIKKAEVAVYGAAMTGLAEC